MLKLALGFLFLSTFAEAFPEGAPSAACIEMRPLGRHTAAPPQSLADSPYSLEVEADATVAGRYTVRLVSSGPQFRGIFLQARTSQNADPEGNWEVPVGGLFQNRECSGIPEVSLTHTSRLDKTASDYEFVWQAPDVASDTTFTIFASVVTRLTTYYVMIPSAPITVPGPGTPQPPTPGTPIPDSPSPDTQTPGTPTPATPNPGRSMTTSSSAQMNNLSSILLFMCVVTILVAF